MQSAESIQFGDPEVSSMTTQRGIRIISQQHTSATERTSIRFWSVLRFYCLNQTEAKWYVTLQHTASSFNASQWRRHIDVHYSNVFLFHGLALNHKHGSNKESTGTSITTNKYIHFKGISYSQDRVVRMLSSPEKCIQIYFVKLILKIGQPQSI